MKEMNEFNLKNGLWSTQEEVEDMIEEELNQEWYEIDVMGYQMEVGTILRRANDAVFQKELKKNYGMKVTKN
ncbi:MAG: hypothetical protein H0U57_05840 [Tatlockia sp.]|nr:hypothetical protein [Tatlockia sp.]